MPINIDPWPIMQIYCTNRNHGIHKDHSKHFSTCAEVFASACSGNIDVFQFLRTKTENDDILICCDLGSFTKYCEKFDEVHTEIMSTNTRHTILRQNHVHFDTDGKFIFWPFNLYEYNCGFENELTSSQSIVIENTQSVIEMNNTK